MILEPVQSHAICLTRGFANQVRSFSWSLVMENLHIMNYYISTRTTGSIVSTAHQKDCQPPHSSGKMQTIIDIYELWSWQLLQIKPIMYVATSKCVPTTGKGDGQPFWWDVCRIVPVALFAT